MCFINNYEVAFIAHMSIFQHGYRIYMLATYRSKRKMADFEVFVDVFEISRIALIYVF